VIAVEVAVEIGELDAGFVNDCLEGHAPPLAPAQGIFHERMKLVAAPH
jgi:hypothetical protein